MSSCFLISPLYDWLGNTPNSERMKLMHRNGTILSCGCEPPDVARAPGSMFNDGAVLVNWLEPESAQKLPPGLAWPPWFCWARGTWLCAGICWVVKVTVSTPP